MPHSRDAETLAFLADLERRHSATPAPRSGRTAQDRWATRRGNFFAGEGFPHDALTRGNGRGGFAGGTLNRINEEWNPGTIGPNRLYQLGGKFMRERARDLSVNNPFARSGIVKYIDNVVECGITPKPQFPETDLRQLWTRAWNRWGGLTAHAARECDVAGDQSIDELASLWLEEIIVGGGVIHRYVELPRKGRSIPLAIDLIPEERFAEHLTQYGSNPKTANPIEQGVEYDVATGRAIAYHVLRDAPNDVGRQTTETVRLPRGDAEYSFLKRRIGQRRGWTLLHASIVWLWALGYYADNELIASQIKSMFAVMVKTGDEADWPDLADSDPETGVTDIYGNVIEKLEPGLMWRGRAGDEVAGVGPNVPGGDSLPWLMLIQRSVAVGMGQSYEELTGDYSQGNMSSVRMAAESVRKGYRKLQKFAIGHLLNPTWSRWADHSVRAGLDGFPRPSEYAAGRDEWLLVNWSTPRWTSPNPVHDANADSLRKKDGTVTDRELVESRGGDLEEHYDQLEYERNEKDRRGLLPVAAEPNAADATNNSQNLPDRDDVDA